MLCTARRCCAAAYRSCRRAAAQSSLGGKLELEDEGSFFVNGQEGVVRTIPAPLSPPGQPPAGNIMVNQMYVHYRIPAGRKGVPLVMVHGSNHTGMTYETTPDGREGWATWFVRQGHPVYVVDHSGRGRSGFNPTPVNAVRDGGADPKSHADAVPGHARARVVEFPVRPEYPKPFPNLQFPLEALDQYLAQLVPNTETTLRAAAPTRSTRSPRSSTRSGRRWSWSTRSRASTASISCASGRTRCAHWSASKAAARR